MDLNLKLDIDADEIQKEVKAKIKAKMIDLVNMKVGILFGNEFNKIRYGNSPEFGFMEKKIDDIFVEVLLDEKYNKFIQTYIVEHFEEALKKSLDKAMEHKANALAFKSVKMHAPRD